MRRPFFWKVRKGWYLKTGDGRNVFLAKERKKAHLVWADLVRADPNGSREVDFLVADLCRGYLASIRTLAESTQARAKYYLDDFCAAYPDLLVYHLAPKHLDDWLDRHPGWGASSVRGAVSSVKGVTSWGAKKGRIPRDPLAEVKRPPVTRREVLVDRAEHELLASAADGPFRAVLIALSHSGARPGTICDVRRKHVSPQGDRWILAKHKTMKKTERPLVVHLSPCLATLTRIRLHFAADRSADAPVFLNRKGKAWTSNAIKCAIDELKANEKLESKLGKGLCAYAYRHTYITNAILAGVDLAFVAELVGHRDLSMISRHYGHLAKAQSHLQAAAAKAMTRS